MTCRPRAPLGGGASNVGRARSAPGSTVRAPHTPRDRARDRTRADRIRRQHDLSCSRSPIANAAASTQTKPFPQIVAMRARFASRCRSRRARSTCDRLPRSDRRRTVARAARAQGNEGVPYSADVQDLRRQQRPSDLVSARGGGARRCSTSARLPGSTCTHRSTAPIVAVTAYVVAGHRFRSRIDMHPRSSPSLVVSLTQLRAGPSLSVGSSSSARRRRRSAPFVNLALVERQALARFHQRLGEPRLGRGPPCGRAGL